MKSHVSIAIATLPMLLTGCPTGQQAPGGPYGVYGSTVDDQSGDDQSGGAQSGDGQSGDGQTGDGQTGDGQTGDEGTGAAPPAGPCEGLPSGDYCGSNPQLMGYEGASSDLVTCQDGSITNIALCPAGCQEDAQGMTDECYDPGSGPYCGNGIVEPGEACDGVDLGGASCTSEGYDGGTLGCGGGCQLEVSQCCSDQCSPGDSTCSGSAMTQCEPVGECFDWGDSINCPYGCSGNTCNNVSCGDGNVNGGEQCDGADLDGESCQGVGFDGGTLQCSAGCTFNTSSCCEQEHTIQNAVYPTYTADGAGCTQGGGVNLKISAQQISDSTVRFHVRKTDNTVWGAAATLTLYVGTGPMCGFPPNVIKETAPVIVGLTTQTIDLMVDPYDAAWAMDEVKEFWVGKSESGFPAARSSGTIEIVRECL